MLLYLTGIVVHDLYIAWRQHWAQSLRTNTSCWWITAKNSDSCAYSTTSMASPTQEIQLAQNITPPPTNRPSSFLHRIGSGQHGAACFAVGFRRTRGECGIVGGKQQQGNFRVGVGTAPAGRRHRKDEETVGPKRDNQQHCGEQLTVQQAD